MSSIDRRTDGQTDGRTRWIQYTPPPTSLGGGIKSWLGSDETRTHDPDTMTAWHSFGSAIKPIAPPNLGKKSFQVWMAHSTGCRQFEHWHHNDHDGVSNHLPHGCLLNRLFRRRSNKASKFRVTGLCVGNSPGPVNSPHKGPVTRKMSPFDDVIMWVIWGKPGECVWRCLGLSCYLYDILSSWGT